MKPAFLTRQIDLLPPEKLGDRVTVIGAGAIGSFLILQMAKLGFADIVVYDDDVVSEENMNSQFYRVRDLGKPKVEALREIVADFTGTEIDIVKGRYDGGRFSGYVIVAVDNMATRKLVFEQHEMKSLNTKGILDPRMGAETAILHVYQPMVDKDCVSYQKSLYDDDAAVTERCTAKTTMYTVNLLSGLVAKTMKDLVTNSTYLKNVSWDIKSFALSAWNSQGINPNGMQQAAPRSAPGESFFRTAPEWRISVPYPTNAGQTFTINEEALIEARDSITRNGRNDNFISQVTTQVSEIMRNTFEERHEDANETVASEESSYRITSHDPLTGQVQVSINGRTMQDIHPVEINIPRNSSPFYNGVSIAQTIIDEANEIVMPLSPPDLF